LPCHQGGEEPRREQRARDEDERAERPVKVVAQILWRCSSFFPITMRWISEVPSPIRRSGASRYSRSISYSFEYPYPPWIRNASSTTSLPVSEANSLAMPASRSERCPASFRRAALSVSRRAASTLVAISASLNWIAWWPEIGRPNVLRSCE